MSLSFLACGVFWITDMDKKPLIYLASPYSHEDASVRQERYEIVSRVTALLISRGYVVFSPIAYSHPLNERIDIPVEDWYRFDRSIPAPARPLPLPPLVCGNGKTGGGIAVTLRIGDFKGVVHVHVSFLC